MYQRIERELDFIIFKERFFFNIRHNIFLIKSIYYKKQ